MRAEAARRRPGGRRVVIAAALTAAVAGAWAIGMEVGGRHGPLWGPGPTRTGGALPRMSPRSPGDDGPAWNPWPGTGCGT